MRILLQLNPISGRGRAAAAADDLERALRRRGHETDRCVKIDDLPSAACGRDLLVVLGGDGSVRQAASAVRGTDTPIYQVPCGTANLFAREWGMDRSPRTLLAAIEQGRSCRLDLARANGRDFLLMASMGFDAEVVADLARHRTGPISMLDYVPPLLRQWWRFEAPTLELSLDGEQLDADGIGLVVVGNCRQYACRLDPARRAEMTDGQLDVVCFPARTRRRLAAWILACRLGRHLQDPRLIYRRARAVEIRASRPVHFQIDGDHPAPSAGSVDGGVAELTIEVEPSALTVLLPPTR